VSGLQPADPMSASLRHGFAELARASHRLRRLFVEIDLTSI